MATIGNVGNIPNVIHELNKLSAASKSMAKQFASVERDTRATEAKLASGSLTPGDVDIGALKTALVEDFDVAGVQTQFNEAKRVFLATDPEPPVSEE